MKRGLMIKNAPYGCFFKDKAPDGIYILSTDDFCCLSREWSKLGKDAVGIAVIKGQIKIVVALDGSTSKLNWGGYARIEITDKVLASEDMNGSSNTDLIIKSTGVGSVYAASYCRAYSCENRPAGTWYLPSLGQSILLYQNKSEIDACLSQLAHSIIPVDGHWSSTESSSSDAWKIYYDTRSYSQYAKSRTYFVRPVSNL